MGWPLFAKFIELTKVEGLMSAYLIYDVEVHDPDAYGAFMAQVKLLFEAFGGRYLVRGGAHEVLEGEWELTRIGCLNSRTWTLRDGFLSAKNTHL